VKPETHVLRAGAFRTNFIARIFDIDFVFLQMRERLAQDRHVGQMKRHVIERLRRGFALEERDRDVVVADRNAVFEFKLLPQSEHALNHCALFFGSRTASPK
jgi:hypothetical protein